MSLDDETRVYQRNIGQVGELNVLYFPDLFSIHDILFTEE